MYTFSYYHFNWSLFMPCIVKLVLGAFSPCSVVHYCAHAVTEFQVPDTLKNPHYLKIKKKKTLPRNKMCMYVEDKETCITIAHRWDGQYPIDSIMNFT